MSLELLQRHLLTRSINLPTDQWLSELQTYANRCVGEISDQDNTILKERFGLTCISMQETPQSQAVLESKTFDLNITQGLHIPEYENILALRPQATKIFDDIQRQVVQHLVYAPLNQLHVLAQISLPCYVFMYQPFCRKLNAEDIACIDPEISNLLFNQHHQVIELVFDYYVRQELDQRCRTNNNYAGWMIIPKKNIRVLQKITLNMSTPTRLRRRREFSLVAQRAYHLDIEHVNTDQLTQRQFKRFSAYD
jgi:hypothetical protein